MKPASGSSSQTWSRMAEEHGKQTPLPKPVTNREAADEISESAPPAGIWDLAVADTEGRARTDRNTWCRPAITLSHALGLSAGSREKQRIGRRQLGRSERGQET